MIAIFIVPVTEVDVKPRSLLVVAAAALMVGASMSVPADASESSDAQIVVTYVPYAESSNAARAVSCRAASRRSACLAGTIQSVVVLKKKVVGTATAELTQSLTLNIKSRKFSEKISMKTIAVTGVGGGVHAKLSVSCGNPCKGTAHFSGALKLGQTINGSVDYTDNVRFGKIHSTASKYTMTFTKAGYANQKASWKSRSYRCDDKFRTKKAGQAAGCVFPSFKPTLKSMADLPGIAANIKNIQTAGPGHYGRAGSGHPLHREASASKKTANRNAVCPRKAPPSHKGKSCDEYPFASSKEGGKKLKPPNRGIAWVPPAEQNSQGGLLNAFYGANRVLDNDPFWVAV